MKELVFGLVCVMLGLVGCDEFGCESAPDSYKGARLVGYSDGEYVQCASYSSDRCSYTLCQSECGGWEEQSWYCI
jgi:hypothetical protein